MLPGSLPNIHPLDKGLPSLSLHALLAQLDINMLMPASSQSTLSLKKDELRARTDPFARFTEKTYCPHPRSPLPQLQSAPPLMRCEMSSPDLGQEVGGGREVVLECGLQVRLAVPW